MGRRLLLLTLLFLSFPCPSREAELLVSDQAAFDALPARLGQALKGKDDITVRFLSGVYFFQERHLTIDGIQRPDIALSIQCSGAVFVPAGGKETRWNDAFVDLEGLKAVELFTPLTQVRRRPEIVDRKTGLCRVRTWEQSVPERKAGDLSLVLTQWYTSQVYKVERISRGYIFFRSGKVTSDGSPWSDPDSDYKYGKVLPRYVLLCPSSAPDGLHRGTASRFLTVSGSRLKRFSLEGARFVGNGGEDCLIQFYGVGAEEIDLSGCQFEHQHGNAVQVQRTDGFHFRNNQLSGLWRTGVVLDYYSSGAVITDNRFDDTGLLMMQDFCIIARGSDFLISGNEFSDFTYGAIGIGTHFREPIPPSSSGVVERNELYCTEGFRRYLMDSGAIYTWTSNKDVTIRKNHIHDIGGFKDNRGIFCDDGTVNVKILYNTVLRIRNSYCIDLRRVASVEKDPQSHVKRTNVGNRMAGNTVDGKVRFENHD